MNTIFQDNKYTKLYHRIIAKHGHQEKPGDGHYYERHHIVPKSMGGTDAAKNFTYARVRTHFLLHVILTKAVKLEYARRARWCVICFSASNDKQCIRRKLRSKFVQLVREEHNADLKLLKWFHDGITTIRLFPEEVMPCGFIPGRLRLPSRAGVVYITDGLQTKRLKVDQPLPTGWAYGQKPERVKQISEQGKKHQMGSGTGRSWINDGAINRYLKSGEELPINWVRGRLKTGKFNPESMRAKSSGTTGKTWKATPSPLASRSPS